jgi:hypothetical protein
VGISAVSLGLGLAATANAANWGGGTATAATSTNSSRVAVSSLTPTSAKNGWGPYEKNTSNGEQAAGDGKQLKINGVTYASGLGVHAGSTLEYNLGGKYAKFESAIGVDDTEGSDGSVTYEVWVDGARKFASRTLTGADAAQRISVDTAKAKTLRLVVTNAGDDANHDHADWADAFLTTSTATSAPSTSTTTAPSSTTTTSPTTKPTTTTSSTTTTKPPTTTTSSTTTTKPPTSTTTSPTSTATAPVTGYPDATNTGAKGTLTQRVGDLEITQAGTVLQNVEIVGQLTIRADNVTLKNVKVTAKGKFWVVINYGKNLTIEDATLVGDSAAQASLGNTGSGYFTGRRINAYGAGDGIRMTSNSKMYDSYVHDLATGSDIHNDGVDLWSAVNAKLIHNRIENAHGQTSAVMISEYGSNANTGVEVRNNFLAGGGWTLYGGAPDTAKGHIVADNVFSTKYFPESGYYGARAYWSSTGNTWSNNTWADGPNKGKPVS